MSTADAVCNARRDEADDKPVAQPNSIETHLIKIGLTRFYRAVEAVEKKHRVVFAVDASDASDANKGEIHVHIVMAFQWDIDLQESYGAMTMILEHIVEEYQRKLHP